MDNYDKIYEQYELCKSYYLKIDKFYYQNFEISPKNELMTEKHFIDELCRFNQEFRSCYINLHLVIDNYNKQLIKLNTDNVKVIKAEIERYKMHLDNIVKLIANLT
jgi:hypothetical protein